MLSSLFQAWSLSHRRSTLCLQWNKRSWTPAWKKICTPDEFALPSFPWQLQYFSPRRRIACSDWFRTTMHSIPWWSRTNTPFHWSLNLYPNSTELDTSPSWMSVVMTLRSNSGCNTQVKTQGWIKSRGRKGMIQLVKHREYKRVSTVYIPMYHEEYIWQTWGLLSKEHALPVRYWLSYCTSKEVSIREVVHVLDSWKTPT